MKSIDFQTGDAVELLVLKNYTWVVQVLLPDHRSYMVHPRNMDKGKKGRPEPGELLIGVVKDTIEGRVNIASRTETLQEFGVLPLSEYHGKFYGHEKPISSKLIPTPNPTSYERGKLLTVKIVDFLFIGMVVRMEDGRENFIHPEDFPRNSAGKPPVFKAGADIKVVVLANRNDGVPYISCHPKHLLAFGHSPNEFMF